MTTKRRRRDGPTYAYQQARARILATSDLCWWCGEAGADGTDHVIPVARGGTDHPANLRPIHHRTPNSQGVKCNQAKGARLPDVGLTTSREW